jgi:hypothetical protein
MAAQAGHFSTSQMRRRCHLEQIRAGNQETIPESARWPSRRQAWSQSRIIIVRNRQKPIAFLNLDVVCVTDKVSFAAATFDTKNEIKLDRDILPDRRLLEAETRLLLAMNLDSVFLVEDHIDDLLLFKVVGLFF